jgi:hypothetical protein
MKLISKLSVLVFAALISTKIQAQRRADLTCESVEKILFSAKEEFKDILGALDAKEQDCNYYFSKASFGIDSTTTLQSCKEHAGHLVLHFDTYIGNDDIQSDLEFKHLEDALDGCLAAAKIKEVKPGDFKRIVQYKLNSIQLTAYQDKVKNTGEMSPLVTISVVNLK